MLKDIRDRCLGILSNMEKAENEFHSQITSLIDQNKDELTDEILGKCFESRYSGMTSYIYVYDISYNFNPVCLVVDVYDGNELRVAISKYERPLYYFVHEKHVVEIGKDEFMSIVKEVFLDEFSKILNI